MQSSKIVQVLGLMAVGTVTFPPPVNVLPPNLLMAVSSRAQAHGQPGSTDKKC